MHIRGSPRARHWSLAVPRSRSMSGSWGLPKLTWTDRRSAPRLTASSAVATSTLWFEEEPREVEAETWIPRRLGDRSTGTTSRAAPLVTTNRSTPAACSSSTAGATASRPSIGPMETEWSNGTENSRRDPPGKILRSRRALPYMAAGRARPSIKALTVFRRGVPAGLPTAGAGGPGGGGRAPLLQEGPALAQEPGVRDPVVLGDDPSEVVEGRLEAIEQRGGGRVQGLDVEAEGRVLGEDLPRRLGGPVERHSLRPAERLRIPTGAGQCSDHQEADDPRERLQVGHEGVVLFPGEAGDLQRTGREQLGGAPERPGVPAVQQKEVPAREGPGGGPKHRVHARHGQDAGAAGRQPPPERGLDGQEVDHRGPGPAPLQPPVDGGGHPHGGGDEDHLGLPGSGSEVPADPGAARTGGRGRRVVDLDPVPLLPEVVHHPRSHRARSPDDQNVAGATQVTRAREPLLLDPDRLLDEPMGEGLGPGRGDAHLAERGAPPLDDGALHRPVPDRDPLAGLRLTDAPGQVQPAADPPTDLLVGTGEAGPETLQLVGGHRPPSTGRGGISDPARGAAGSGTRDEGRRLFLPGSSRGSPEPTTWIRPARRPTGRPGNVGPRSSSSPWRSRSRSS